VTTPTKKAAPIDLQQLAGIVEDIQCVAKDELSRVMSCVATIRAAAEGLEPTTLVTQGPTNCPEVVIQAVGRDAATHSDMLWMALERLNDVSKALEAARADDRNPSTGSAR
jgi:hypothetical protein